MTGAYDPRLDLGSQLTGTAADVCREALDELRPVVRVAAGAHPATARAAAALIHLLARLHPHTMLDGDAELDANPWNASTVATAVADIPRAEPSCEPRRDVVVAVGEDVIGDWHIGGDDWTMVLSDTPVVAAPSDTGLGLQVAACFAAAEMLKVALAPLGLIGKPALPQLVWNLIDYRLRAAPRHGAERRRAPPPIALFGAGSVGSSAAAHLAGGIPSSVIDIVDADTFDPHRNPYRYPASTRGTSGPKAIWVADMMTAAGWRAHGHTCDVAGWVTGRGTAAFAGIAISSVDRVDSRADVADALAAMTLSAGVKGLALHLQREHPDDDFACPFCQYLNVEPSLPGTEIVAAGQGRAYAEATVPVAPDAAVTVSAPAVSWLAGALAAAEVAKVAAGLPLLDRRVDLDLSGTPMGAVRRIPRDRSGRCLCASPFRRRATRARPSL